MLGVSRKDQVFYITSTYFDTDVPANRQYKELVYLGQLLPHIRKRVVGSGPSDYVTPSILKTILPDEWDKLSQYSGKYFYNTPSHKSIEIAEMKIDEVRPWPSIDKIRAYGQVISDRMLEIPLTAESITDEETRSHIDLTKGASIPWKWLGFKSRQEVYESSVWKNNFENILFLKRLLPVYESCGKEELAEIQDLLAQKVRTFQTTSAHLLYWQIRLFSRGTENLKNYKWSKYGFNPFYGGTDKWYREMNVLDSDGKLKYSVRLNWDINGYDRKIFLYWVADRRLKYWLNANSDSPHKDIAKWVTDALKLSYLLFHNGDFVIRKRGNNSGSGMTTVNNIEAGFEVMADLLVYVYHRKHGTFPDEDLVMCQLINLFGDDNSMALYSCFDGILDEPAVKDRLLNQHGLVCKWIIGGIERPWADLPFLGFVFSEYKNFFIPKWNLQRLVHPILYTPTRKTSGQYLQQVYSLLIMSFAHQDVFPIIRNTYVKLLQHFRDSGQPDIKVMIRLGVPLVEHVEVFYLGFESESKIPLKWTGGIGGPLVIDIDMTTSSFNEDNGNSQQNTDLPIRITYDNLEWCTKEDCAYTHYVHLKDFCKDLTRCVYGHVRLDHLSECAECFEETSKRISYDPTMYLAYAARQRAQVAIQQGANTRLRYRGDDIPENRPLRTLNSNDLFKEGSFNPYGNGQTSSSLYINIFRPNYETLSDGTIKVTATVQYDDANPETLSGIGEDNISAYAEWVLQIEAKFSIWSPTLSPFLKALQTLPKLEGSMGVLWEKDAPNFFSKIVRNTFFFSGPQNKVKAIRSVPSISPARRYVQISKPTCIEDYAAEGYLQWTYMAIIALDGSNPQIYSSTTSVVSQEAAFTNWVSDLVTMFDAWEPPSLLVDLIRELRKTPPPPTDHPLIFIWTSDIDHTVFMIKQGFNPYGNGQPKGKLTYPVFLKQHKVQFDKEKLSKQQRLDRYNSYLSKRPPLTTTKQDPHNKIAPTKKEAVKHDARQITNHKSVTVNPGTIRMAKKMESGITKLSPCTRKYYAATVCPFYSLDSSCDRMLRSLHLDEEGGPCIPTIPNVKSRKFSAFARGEFQTSSSGVLGNAFIAFAPRRIANDASAGTYNLCPIYTSTSSTPGVAGCPYPILDAGSPVDTGVTGFNLNTDYSSSQLPLVAGRGIKYRVVAAGLRVRYIGTEQNRAGILHGIITPNHDTVSQANIGDLGKNETYFRNAVTRDWVQVTHSPVMDDDFLYFPDSIQNPSFFGSIFSTQSFQHYMGFQITDCPNGAFEWEVVTHFEVVGSEVRGLTPTPADTTGLSAVLNVVTPSVVPEINKMATAGKDLGGILKQGMEMVSGLVPPELVSSLASALI